ncbi:hypothetical protein BDZ91DRAFT_788763 [Kalaharituber pfeilii]|nr:hypothetical protein BDZ91DRAFT_788763 [Kalaharituber pfeilii]
MAPPLVGQMSGLFSPYTMSPYAYPSLSQAKAVKPDTARHLTPYLGPRSKLSQVWFNRWTILLALIVVRIFLSTQSLGSDIDSAEREALSACVAVERAGSAMASMPHYMAQGVNELSAKAIEGGVEALHKTLFLALAAVREIVVFVISMMVSTYACLITLAISGSIGVVLDATETIGDAVNNTLKKATEEIDGQLTEIRQFLVDVKDKLDNVGSFFGVELTIPELKIPSLDNLKKGLQIPTSFNDQLQQLRDNIPTFREVKEAGENRNINSSLAIYEFDRSVFPIPQKDKLTFCSENNDISNFFLNLREVVNKTKTTVISVVITLGIFAIIPMAYLELRRWRIMKQRAAMFSANPAYDPVDVAYLASRPSSGTWGLRFANIVKSERKQVLIRWAVAYVTSPAALFVLSLGFAGLISTLSQFIVLKQVEKAVPELAEHIGGFAEEVVDMLNTASIKFADSTNDVLQNVTAQLNEEVFGWLTEGAQTLNNTLNTFSSTMQDGINKFLGGTPLEKPVEDVIDCLIGLKIESLQKGLTWIHENAKISFPEIPQDTFSLGALNSLDGNNGAGDSFLADPEGASSDMVTETLFKLSAKWQDSLTTEAIISGSVCLIWVLVLVIALIRTGFLWFGRDKVRGDGGGRGNISTFGAGLPTGSLGATYGGSLKFGSTSRHGSAPPVPEYDAYGVDAPSKTFSPSRSLTPTWVNEKAHDSTFSEDLKL